MRVAILGSGSKGNCLVIDGGGVVVLVDVGFSPREVRRRMAHLELDLQDIDAILITHAHGDHVKGARQLAGSLGKQTWATDASKRFANTFTALKNHVVVTPGERFAVGGLSILPTKTSHDEPGSVAYTIDDGDEAFAICTDLGDPSDSVADGLRGVDTLMLEFNHDRHMLQTGPYTSHLKRRVASRFGHLCNDDSALLLKKTVTPSMSRLLCAHLSEVNNTPNKALEAARSVVDGMDVSVAVAPQHAPTGWLRVRRREGVSSPAPAARAPRSPSRSVADSPGIVDAVLVDTRDAAPSTTETTATGTSAKASPATTTTAPPFIALRQAVRQRQHALFAGPALIPTTPTPRTKVRR